MDNCPSPANVLNVSCDGQLRLHWDSKAKLCYRLMHWQIRFCQLGQVKEQVSLHLAAMMQDILHRRG